MTDRTPLSESDVIERLSLALKVRANSTPLHSPLAPVVRPASHKPRRTISWMVPLAAIAAAIIAVLAFVPSGPRQTSVNVDQPRVSNTSRGDPTTNPANEPRFASFGPCHASDRPDAQAGWLCHSILIPLDRSKPAGQTTQLAIYVLPHTDRSSPALEPLFTTPVGPGYRGWYDPALIALHDRFTTHHDIVFVDPRGTGHSGQVVCPQLQNNTSGPDEAKGFVGACAATLGQNAARYGAADRAIDLDDVRRLLGYELIDLYGLSKGAADVEAYAYRYPQHLRAIVIDSGSVETATPPDFHDFFHIGEPQSLIETMARECASIAACHAADADPAATVVALIQQLRVNPIPSKNAVSVAIDEGSLVSLITSAEPKPLVTALDALRDGEPQLVRSLLTQLRPDNGNGQEFSAGAQVAQLCNDAATPWLPTDSLAARLQKLTAAISALPDEAFSPFSKDAWLSRNPPDFCLTWPAPSIYNPVVPQGSTTIAVPTLLLSSDFNRDDLTSRSRLLLNTFINAKFLVVADANNAAVNHSGSCIADIVGRFFETLDTGDTACAATSTTAPVQP